MTSAVDRTSATRTGSTSRTVAVNALGFVEHPSFATSHPYEIDLDGRPYVPTGLGGVVLGVRLGDGVDAFDTDQVVPGLTLVHPDPAARAALTALSCIGNTLTVRTGAAAGAVGAVSGKRGEEGRVLGVFAQEVLAAMRPGDQIAVATRGQGARPVGFPDAVALLNIDPDLLPALGVEVEAGIGVDADAVTVAVAATVASRQIGNGIGRPAHQWDVALCLHPGDPLSGRLRLGDLVAVTDLDARYNVGFRRGWCTVGVVVSGSSPLPGHGPGLTPILSGPAASLRARTADPAGRLTEELLGIGTGRGLVGTPAPSGADTVQR